MRCAYCGQDDHDTDHCPKTWNGQGNLAKRRCEYCGSQDHYYKDCPKLR